jgi:hypothetical protein
MGLAGFAGGFVSVSKRQQFLRAAREAARVFLSNPREVSRPWQTLYND